MNRTDFARIIFALLLIIVLGGFSLPLLLNSRIFLGISIFIIPIALFIGLLFHILKKQRSIDIITKSAQTHNEHAKVVSKASQVVGDRFYTKTIYFVSFEFPQGERKNFPVNINQFNTLAENDNGILTFKENGNYLLFVNFHRQT